MHELRGYDFFYSSGAWSVLSIILQIFFTLASYLKSPLHLSLLFTPLLAMIRRLSRAAPGRSLLTLTREPEQRRSPPLTRLRRLAGAGLSGEGRAHIPELLAVRGYAESW